MNNNSFCKRIIIAFLLKITHTISSFPMKHISLNQINLNILVKPLTLSYKLNLHCGALFLWLFFVVIVCASLEKSAAWSTDIIPSSDTCQARLRSNLRFYLLLLQATLHNPLLDDRELTCTCF